MLTPNEKALEGILAVLKKIKMLTANLTLNGTQLQNLPLLLLTLNLEMKSK